MKPKGARRSWQPLRDLVEAPRLRKEAETLSTSIDREMAEPGAAGDPELGAMLRAAAPRTIPGDLLERSWTSLERELFPAPPLRSAATAHFEPPAPSRSRGGLTLRIPYWGVVVAAIAAAAVGWGAWATIHPAAGPIIERTAASWNHLRHFHADVQFVSRLPMEIQGSGEELYEAPDKTRFHLNTGAPAAIVVDGDSTSVQATGGVITSQMSANLRLLAQEMRPDTLLQGLQSSTTPQYQGEESVLGQPCEVVSFRWPAALAPWPGSAGAGEAPPRIRVWIGQSSPAPLQTEIYRPDGSLALSYRFTSIAFDSKLP